MARITVLKLIPQKLHFAVDNYPGFAKGVAGLELADQMRLQAERFGAKIELGEVLSIHDEGELKKLATTSGNIYAKTVLITTGSDYKKVNDGASLLSF